MDILITIFMIWSVLGLFFIPLDYEYGMKNFTLLTWFLLGPAIWVIFFMLLFILLIEYLFKLFNKKFPNVKKLFLKGK